MDAVMSLSASRNLELLLSSVLFAAVPCLAMGQGPVSGGNSPYGRPTLVTKPRPTPSLPPLATNITPVKSDNPSPQGPSGMTLTGSSELTEEGVVQQVLTRNPTLAQMAAAADAAAARYPQVISLEDPMFAASQYPSSIGSRNVDFAYRFEASQRIPYPGKRALRGQNAVPGGVRTRWNQPAFHGTRTDARKTLVCWRNGRANRGEKECVLIGSHPVAATAPAMASPPPPASSARPSPTLRSAF